MRLWLLFLCISSAFPYKILFFSPTLSRSHMISNGRYADELARAGHDVVLFEPDWLNIVEKVESAKVAKRWTMKGFSSALHDILSGFSNDIFADDSIYDISMGMIKYNEACNVYCKQILENEEIMEKLRSEKFDAFFGEQVHLCGNGVAHILGIKSQFWIQSCPIYEYTNWYLGQPTPLSYIPAHGIDINPNLSYLDRAWNLFYGSVGFYVGYRVHTATTNVFRQKYGPDFPHVGELAASSDIIFVSTDEFMDIPRPVLPNMVNTGGLGVSEAGSKPLGAVFEQEMTKGRDGVIFFSMGTIANTTRIPEVMTAVVSLARAFPNYHFIARAEPEDRQSRKTAADVPNLSVHSWIPQPSLLLHPRLKVFIAHAGYNGIMEAARAGVPMVTIPMMFDQPKNSRAVEINGWGIHVERRAIKYDHQKIIDSVREILQNDKYKKSALRIQKLIKEKPFSAVERMVKTTEFVLANGGVKELLTAGRKMSLIHLYNLDIIAPFGAILIGIVVVIFKFFTCICCRKRRAVEKQKIN